MRLILLLVLVASIYGSNTFLQFNSEGIENIIKTFVDLNAPKVKQTIDINKDISFGVGSAQIRKADIFNLEVNSKNIQVLLLPNVQGVHIKGGLESVSITLDAKIKIFGFVAIDGPIDLKLKGSKVALTLQLGMRSKDNGLQFSLWENRFDIFRPGVVHFKLGESWYQNILSYVADGIADVVLFFAKFKIGDMVSEEITKLGSNLPNQLVLNGTLEGVTIPLEVAKTPTIESNWVNVDFKCGGNANRVVKKNQPSFEFRLGKECINEILQQVYSLSASPINVTAIAQSISDITEINTKTLGGIFPDFLNQPEPVDVRFEVTLKQGSAGLTTGKDFIKVDAPLKARIFLVQSQELNRQAISVGRRIEILNRMEFKENHYLDFNATATVQLGVVKTYKGFTISILKLNTKDYEITQQDEENNLIDPDSWESIKDVALAFAQSPANSVLYDKVVFLDGYLDMKSVDILLEESGVAFVVQPEKK